MAASISGIGVGLGLSCSSNLSKTLHSSQSSGFRVKMTVSVEYKKKNYTLQKSEEAFNAAKNLMHGGVNSPVRAFKSVGGQPIVIDSVKGSHMWDVDDNEYIDYVGSWGSAIIGHADHEVLAALAKTMKKGTSFGPISSSITRPASPITFLKPISSYSSPKPNFNNNPPLVLKIIRQWKSEKRILGKDKMVNCASLIQTLSKQRKPHVAHQLVLEMNSQGLVPNTDTLSALLLCYAENGLFLQAQAIWEEMLNTTSFTPSIQLISKFMDVSINMGDFHQVDKILNRVILHRFNLLPKVYPIAISCFGKHGQLDLMENTLKDMISKGLPIDSVTRNALVRYYSSFGSLTEMETAYGRLKRSRLLIDEEGIRAMSFAYIKEGEFYKLGEFLNGVGLGRTNIGNLLWNLLLLSYAANFKMKTMQRQFLKMLDSGFVPDITTFNIRALAFSKMSMFWDLHLSLEHMKHEGILPDLVTYGCVVDAYLDRRLGRNLDFVLNNMNVDDSPLVLTDPLVFEALGKGDFQSSSEAFMEFKGRKKWTYRQLVAVYLKKQFRRNQIFWNY